MSESTQPHPPATPIYILRGHASPIHGLHIFHQNLRLISGDADGWVVVWNLVSKRPIASWKAHDGALLEVKGFSPDVGTTEVYTHGRDHKLRVWRFRAHDEQTLDKRLPVDIAGQTQSPSTAPSQPWLRHSLPVNALNFCAFAMVSIAADAESSTPPATLIAVPNALNSGAIDLFHLPSERRVCTIPADTTVQTGMVMAVQLVLAPAGELSVAAAYEDGHVAVFGCRGALREKDFSRGSTTVWEWEKLYFCRPHTQPVLSIDVVPAGVEFISSAADALLVKHPIPPLGSTGQGGPLKQVDTKHSGQQGLRVRSDGRVFATAGWDARVRVYAVRTLRELAVLKWHKEGCYAVAFGAVNSASASDGDAASGAAAGEEFSLATVQKQRNYKVQNTHWLAAGSKDGKISLWDIY
ncbi:WD repeat protein [Aspergillus terreus]|uniref:ASTRA-associated protein 1 n=1 Tax=Aspergillus terreus TaxID=33178 RepID=A0A5M3ZCB3_ASPTE|nr:hypothetical protein ATETN484_0011031000 [Aspergillus terreus]GFF18947.1 WD repeat protein [Aspergillus terreus]